MRRQTKRDKQKKALTIIEGIFFVIFFVSMSAMDSEAWWIPSVAFIGSAIGLFITYRLEEKRYGNER